MAQQNKGTGKGSRESSSKDVYVITGGAGGMGYATAEILGKRDVILLLADLSADALENARERLEANGATARIDIETCDVSNPDDVLHLADAASHLGIVRGVVHTAGVSPSMDDYKKIIAINALGTLYIDRAFLSLAEDGPAGFTMINVASMAAYMLPNAMLPTRAYKSVKIGPTVLAKKLENRCRIVPASMRSQMAYPISKNFVTWYTKHLSTAYGEVGAHIISVSPGSFDTAMGELEKDAGAGAMVDFAAIKRFGEPAEVGKLLAWLVSESPLYLTGTDILIDGGVVANMTLKDMMAVGKGTSSDSEE